MTLGTWVEARIINVAPVLVPLLAKAIVDDVGPLIQQMETTLTHSVEQEMQTVADQLEGQLKSALTQLFVDLPGRVVQGIKSVFPFPL